MIVRACTQCGKKNRIPAQHLSDQGACGACKTAIEPLAEPLDITDAADFEAIVRSARVPVLVDFWAAWCGPCRMAAPEVKKAAAALAGRAVVVKVDTEALPGIAARHQVQGIPNFVVYAGGRVVQQQAGLVDHRRMIDWLTRAGATGAQPSAHR